MQQGGKFVIFPYTVSFLIMTLKRSSDVYFIRPNENTFKYSYGFILINLIVGWWGLPWGPIYTIGALCNHITGGKDFTQAVMGDLLQNDTEANTSTYNIGSVLSSNSQAETKLRPTYNIPV